MHPFHRLVPQLVILKCTDESSRCLHLEQLLPTVLEAGARCLLWVRCSTDCADELYHTLLASPSENIQVPSVVCHSLEAYPENTRAPWAVCHSSEVFLQQMPSMIVHYFVARLQVCISKTWHLFDLVLPLRHRMIVN